MLKLVVLVVTCLTQVMSNQTCSNYKTHIQPLIESGDVKGLQQVFKVMNSDNRSFLAFRLPPIEDSVWPEVSAIKKLISLSRPFLKDIAKPNLWPENNNIRISESGVSDSFKPSSSHHGGIRYIYNCVTYQEKSCFKKECQFDPSKPIIVTKRHEEIYVPIENFLAADGSEMSGHIFEDKGSRSYVINGFSKMSVRECGARQVFYNGTSSAEDCFDSLKFFSLPEVVEYRSKPEDDSSFEKKKRKVEVPQSLVYVRRAFFAVMI